MPRKIDHRSTSSCKLRSWSLILPRPTWTRTPMDTPTKRFHLQSKKFFLTFPQNDTAKETALENIKLHLPCYSWVMIAQENHKDGEKHLHIGIEFKEKVRTRKVDYFDCITGKHGNYKTMKSVAGTIKYLRKEDPSPLIDGDVPVDGKSKKDNKGDSVASMINAGINLHEVYNEEPGYFMTHKRQIEELAGWLAVKKLKESLTAFPGRFLYTGLDQGTMEITSWLNGNLNKDVPRPIKSAQLYVRGPANSRKTSLATFLSKWFRIYWVPKDEAFYDYYNDEDYDIIVFDEFKMQKSLQWINSFIEGAPVLVRKKGVSGTMKLKNLPVIFLTNYSVQTLLADPDDQVLFESRLKLVNLTSPVDLDNLATEAITEPVTPESPVYNFSFPEVTLHQLYCDEEL